MRLAPIAGGLIAYMAYLWAITGSPLAFKDIQIAWGRELTPPWSSLLYYLNHPTKIARPWNLEILNFLTAIIAIASVVTYWRKGWRDLAVFTALTLLAPLSTGTLMSMTRYLSVAPGLFLALAVWAEDRPRLGQMLLGSLGVALAIMCILFALDANIAGA